VVGETGVDTSAVDWACFGAFATSALESELDLAILLNMRIFPSNVLAQLPANSPAAAGYRRYLMSDAASGAKAC
jgi:hypothetical protein